VTLSGHDLRSPTEKADLAAALAGDEDAFRRLTEGYRRELHLHCYRMLGSFQDAEDALQETLLRAWRYLTSFEGRSAFRAWLYRIATNVCLSEGARRRVELPPLPAAFADLVGSDTEPVSNLSPYPDALLAELEASWGIPDAQYDLHESVQLAFLAAVQLLPPRQRAVLILRDVLGWSASEVADLLDSTTASVNSALQRARATLDQQRQAGRLHTGRTVPSNEIEQSRVRRYLEAWDSGDIDRLVGLLKHDAVLTMPPWPLRYTGRDAIGKFFATVPAGGALEQFRLIPTRANRQPALAYYRFAPTGPGYRALGLLVLTIDGDAIAEITVFHDPAVVLRFGLPTSLAIDYPTT